LAVILALSDGRILTIIPLIVLAIFSALLVFRDFGRLRLILYKKTGFEFVKPEENEKSIKDYEELMDLVSRKSNRLAYYMQQVKYSGLEGDGFDNLSTIIKQGLQDDPTIEDHIAKTMGYLSTYLDIKQYIDDDDRAHLHIKQVTDGIIVAECDSTGTKPVEGTNFILYADIPVGKEDPKKFEKIVASAELSDVSGDMYSLCIIEWSPGALLTKTELSETLIERSPRLEVNEMGLEEMKLQEMEDTYNYLRRVRREVVTDDA